MPLPDLDFSFDAQRDIFEIDYYSVTTRGREQADKYLSNIFEALARIQRYPQSGSERTDLDSGLRGLRSEHHVIFYRIRESSIRIVRILHNRLDVHLVDLTDDV